MKKVNSKTEKAKGAIRKVGEIATEVGKTAGAIAIAVGGIISVKNAMKNK